MKDQNYKLINSGEFLSSGAAFTIKEAFIYLQNNNIDVKLVDFIVGTGLFDSKNREIFEGDIVRAYKANSYLDGFYCVAWDDQHGKWAYYEIDMGLYGKEFRIRNIGYQVGSSGNLQCEILENIYISPELEYFSF